MGTQFITASFKSAQHLYKWSKLQCYKGRWLPIPVTLSLIKFTLLCDRQTGTAGSRKGAGCLVQVVIKANFFQCHSDVTSVSVESCTGNGAVASAQR